MSRQHGCHNRPPLHDAIQAQDGWTGDGRSVAEKLGNGNASEGIRIALAQAKDKLD